MKKVIALILAIAMILTLAISVTAEEGPAVKYQLVGTYREDGEYAARMNTAFLVELYEDGTVSVDRFLFAAGDNSDFAANTAYAAGYMTGTWEAVEKDGLDAFKIDVHCVDDTGAEVNPCTVYAYDNWGEMEFDLSFPIVPGMQYMRSATVAGGEEIKYTDRNAFIADYFEGEAAAPAAEAPAAEAPAEEQPAAAPAASVADFAGEYDVINVNADGQESYFEEFIIEEDGTVHGAVEGSGLTGFEGTVDIDGNITCELPRLGGTLTGTVDTNGNVSGTSEVRGRTSTWSGTRFED